MATANAINSLSNRHHKIVELCLRGFTTKQIAEHLAMTPSAISAIIHSPNFQHQLALRRARFNDVADRSIVSDTDAVANAIREKTLAAVERLGLVMTSGKDGDAVRACEALLDRGGYPRVTRTEDKSVSVVIGPDDLARLTETLEMISSIEAIESNESIEAIEGNEITEANEANEASPTRSEE